jgi:hypothetical protein
MKLRTRYTLVTTGVIAFFLLSPFIVMYLSGTRYDFKNHHFVKTGVIVARTNPRGAKIIINGKVRGSTPASLRFIDPGMYDLSLQKEGYFTWNKRVDVRAQYVTWANLDLTNVTLFRSVPKRTDLGEGVINFYSNTKKVLYATSNSLRLVNAKDGTLIHEIALPRIFTNLEITAPENNENVYLIYSDAYYSLYNPENNTLTEISDLVLPEEKLKKGQSPSPNEFQFADGKLYQLRSNTLNEIDWSKHKSSLILNNIVGFHFSGNALYYVNKPATGAAANLVRTELPGLNPTVLAENVPALSKAKILITNQNQIFILGDNNLYAVNRNLEVIAHDANSAKIDSKYRKVIYSSNNEIGYYDLDTQKTITLTRSSQTIKNADILFGIGWSFFTNDGRLQNMEIDSRDHQNNYTFGTASENAKFTIDEEGKNIIFLDNGKLINLGVREPTSILLPHS